MTEAQLRERVKKLEQTLVRARDLLGVQCPPGHEDELALLDRELTELGLMKEPPPTYSLTECIDALGGYLYRDERFYPIETAISSIHWMKAASIPDSKFQETYAALVAWLDTPEPDLPDELIEETLFWLRALGQSS